jgi:hypothetical protein
MKNENVNEKTIKINDKRFSNLLIGHGLKLEHCIQIGVNVHLHSSRI